MMNKEEIVSWFKFCRTRGLGSKRILKLLSLFGNIRRVLDATNEELLASKVFNEVMLESLTHIRTDAFVNEEVNKIFESCKQLDIAILPMYESNYPKELILIPDTPLTLYLKGNINLLNHKKIAMVGSRDSDENAKNWAYEWSKRLSDQGFVIVSGGAKGIDYIAHQGCLDANGKTICVLGSGFLNFFPETHTNLFDEISKKGLLISEYPPHFVGSRISLLQRNRIISGLSKAIVQVTSSDKHGSMTQLNIAIKQKIPIFSPAAELNFYPNEGILKAKAQVKIFELSTIDDLLRVINNIPTFGVQKQVSLLQ